MYNQMTNGSVMSSHSNQMRQFYNGQRTNSSGPSQQQLQLHQQLQQQQQIIAVPTVQSSYGGQSMTVNGTNARITNTQQRNALRNMPITTPPVSEIIDLSSPPSSPGPLPQTSQDTVRTMSGWELKRIPERPWGHDSQNNAAYKVSKLLIWIKYC